jgi:superfamily II helicase
VRFTPINKLIEIKVDEIKAYELKVDELKVDELKIDEIFLTDLARHSGSSSLFDLIHKSM